MQVSTSFPDGLSRTDASEAGGAGYQVSPLNLPLMHGEAQLQEVRRRVTAMCNGEAQLQEVRRCNGQVRRWYEKM